MDQLGSDSGSRADERRPHKGLKLVLLLGLPLLVAAALYRFGGPTAPTDPNRIALRVIVLSNDDGSRRAAIEPHEVEAAVAFANEVFAPAGITFVFDPDDMEEMASTLLNGMAGPHQENWDAIMAAGNAVAQEDVERITVFYRHGPREQPAEHSFAAFGYDFIGMPGYQVHVRCGQPCTSALAHELGHFLGLRHTFRGERPKTMAEAEARAQENRDEGIQEFDGDGLADTAPDPAIAEHNCGAPPFYTLAGFRYEPPVDNIMSYYYLDRRLLTRQQIEIARYVLAYRRAHDMKFVPGWLPAGAIEAEDLEVVPGGCQTAIERMDEYRKGRWGGDAQLLMNSGPDCSVTVKLEVRESGTYDIEMWATKFPYYGNLHVFVDEALLGRFDMYAPLRVATGPMDLGPMELDAGLHEVRFSVPDANERAKGTLAGVDAFVLRPRDAD